MPIKIDDRLPAKEMLEMETDEEMRELAKYTNLS